MATLATTPRNVFPPEWQEQLDARLIGTEQVLWWGQPMPEQAGRRFSVASIIGLVVVAFAVYWSYRALEVALDAPVPNWNPLILGAGLFVVGIAILFVPVWTTVLEQKKLYVLTNGRAMVFKALPLGLAEVEDYFPHQLLDMICMEDESGAGDLVFKKIESVDNEGIVEVKEYGFMGLEDVREIGELIRNTFDREPWTTPKPAAGNPTSEGAEPVEPTSYSQDAAEATSTCIEPPGDATINDAETPEVSADLMTPSISPATTGSSIGWI